MKMITSKLQIRCCLIIIIGEQSIETVDVLTSYMENYSIHSVGFISKTNAFRRAFWLFVVLTGFTGAGLKQKIKAITDFPLKLLKCVKFLSL